MPELPKNTMVGDLNQKSLRFRSSFPFMLFLYFLTAYIVSGWKVENTAHWLTFPFLSTG